jgi:hypothetical protein
MVVGLDERGGFFGLRRGGRGGKTNIIANGYPVSRLLCLPSSVCSQTGGGCLSQAASVSGGLSMVGGSGVGGHVMIRNRPSHTVRPRRLGA